MKEVTPKAHRCWPTHCPAIFEVTPAEMRCHIAASCPAIFEVTPEPMACELAASCPAIFEQQDGHLIIGKKVIIPEELKDRIGIDEILIWVPKGLVKPGDE
jgi:hypothetical protein